MTFQVILLVFYAEFIFHTLGNTLFSSVIGDLERAWSSRGNYPAGSNHNCKEQGLQLCNGAVLSSIDTEFPGKRKWQVTPVA